jgi:oligopeptide transport system ATP-binding protein
MALLEVRHLQVNFDTPEGEVHAVSGIDFDLEPGDALAIVGESGSGKTQAMLAILGLLAENGHATGTARFRGKDLMEMTPAELNTHRGRDIAMIFQDPMTALNPYLTIEKQMTEVVMHHQGLARKEARAHAVELLRAVRIPEPEKRIRQYPHEYSGGMRQRVMVAMGLLCEPDILIADEPTTALDVTVQAQIAQLMAELRRQSNTAIVLITHDLGIVAGLCDRVLVMYGGEVVEYGTVEQVYYEPAHPYTRGLLESVPRLDRVDDDEMHAIPGNPPNLLNLPKGCGFRSRCTHAFEQCGVKPQLTDRGDGHLSRCHLEDLE